MNRLADFVAGRRTKWITVIAVLVVAMGLGMTKAGGFEGAQENESSSFLPGDAESVKALEVVKELPGGERAAAIVVYQREGGLTPEDEQKVAADRAKFNEEVEAGRITQAVPMPEPELSEDGSTALLVTSFAATGDNEAITDGVEFLREELTPSGGGLETAVTGPAGFSADAIEVFEQIDGALLLAAAGLVFVLLILIYRSPIFWFFAIFPILMAEFTARGLGTVIAEAGVTINGQSGGILPVLVLGAGTDYALLLVARYREELRRHEDKHEAMQIAVRRAGPAIFASGMTVVAGLLCLSLAEVNGTAGLGPIGAMGIAVAMVFSLTLLPAFVLIGGRPAFWPFVPHVGDDSADETHGFWRRVGDRVAARPRRTWLGAMAILLVCCLGFVTFNTNLTSDEIFRDDVESVAGQALVSSAFPPGANAPTDVIVPDPSQVQAVTQALEAKDDAVVSVRRAGEGEPGVRLEVVLTEEPYSTEAYDLVRGLRDTVKEAGGDDVLVGGPTAQEADLRTSASRDNYVIIPIVLVVIFVILALLLRAIIAPLILIGTVVISFAAALGVGSFVATQIFGFTGFDPSLPLLVFVFLVALGVDYNIFLMARVREETQKHGAHAGVVRGLAVTGAVITSAGIVLAGTFMVLGVLPLVFLTEIGFTVAFGVLLDTFLVRSVLVPALALDIGARIWWPSKLAQESGE
jgi:RND superfamily putative drug exporter